jgi:signal transduction histidine kinase
MINYIRLVSEILAKDKDSSGLVLELANLIIPKMMEISNDELDIMISLSEKHPKIAENESNSSSFKLIKALIEYKKANYELSIHIVSSFLEDTTIELSNNSKAVSYTILGINHRSMGERDIAFNYFQRALELYPDTISLSGLRYLYGISLYHIAEIYGELKEYDEMLTRHELLCKVTKEHESIDLENRALNGLGRAYVGLGLYDVALSYFQTAEKNSKLGANKPFIARNQHDLGTMFSLLEDTEQSLLHYNKALQIRRDNDYNNAAVTTQIAISKVLLKQKKYQEAITILEEARIVAEALKVKRKECQILETLSAIYEETQDFERSLNYHKIFHNLKAELDNVNKTQVEAQRVREANTQLKQQKKLIENQKRQIEITLQKLQVTNKYLENFATVAAHDLKAPIRIASSFAKIIEKKYNEKWDKSDAEYFAYITTNIGKLSQMIDDLLALSKLDQDLLPAKKVKVSNILKEVEKRLIEKISTTKTTLVYQKSISTLIAHNSLITQLFQNIIDNAIKYRSLKSPLIEIKTQMIRDNFCQFEVKDNGKGISAEEQKYIFELFRGTSRNDSSGIGLATCKKIVTHYGGNIWIKSDDDKGTSIFFTLPLAE